MNNSKYMVGKESEQIDSILSGLVSNGSKIDYLKELKEQSLDLINKDISLGEVMTNIANNVFDQTIQFLNNKNKYGVNYISGISSCIFLPSFDNSGDIKLKFIGGNRNRDFDFKVNENTLFDVASITKLYTLVLLFKLEELGLIDLNQPIVNLNPDFKGLGDFTCNDLIRLHGELRTDGNVATAGNLEEANKILKTLYLVSDSREENKYNDFGAIVLSYTLEKVISKALDKEMTFSDIMNEYLFKPLNIHKTMFNPDTTNVSGNGNDMRKVHDPKARILGGAVGSAGLFTTSDDLARLAKNIYSINYINKNHIARLGEVTFPNSKQNNKGNLGIYVKHPLGIEKTYTPSEFADRSFSHQGWTGSVATFDPTNLIHQNILVNAVYKNENKDLVRSDKPFGFGAVFDEYLIGLTKNTMLMYVIKQYYNKYCKYNENVEIKYIK